MSQIINLSSVEDARTIMQDKFPLMIEYFLEDAATYINSIDEGLAANDAEKVQAPAHTIKSSAAQIGADKVSDLAKQIECMAKDIMNSNSQDFQEISSLCKKLKEAFAETEPELKKLM